MPHLSLFFPERLPESAWGVLTMKWLGKIWRALADENQRRRLALLGTAGALAVAGGWQLYLHMAESKARTLQEGRPAVSELQKDDGQKHVGQAASQRGDKSQVRAGRNANVKIAIESEGDFGGDAGIKDIDIKCAEDANVSSVVKSDGNITGSVVVSGVKITGNRAEDCVTPQ
jgi:hypothetical protein